ncbi:MAG TPA: hypothetical protein PLD73_11070 [Candidatus Hydrogenedentes bacterium]|nr:hypothetical protein [Candidatus Hydrogenedentota bacterium]
MNAAWLALFAWLGAATQSAAPVTLPADPAAAVERVLESDPSLLAQHRGYQAWIGRYPAAASAEEAFTTLLLTTGFSLPVDRFDEALVRFPESAAAMDAYYAALASNGEIRAAVDDLHRFELAQRAGREAWDGILAYLRAHPEEALTFLKNPQWAKPTPDALRPLADAARKKDPSLDRLRAAFQALHDQPEAHLHVFPWWKAYCGEESLIREPFDALMAHFRQYPHHFWVWHRREIVLAETPGVRAWLRHWHRTVRRSEGLGRAYWLYLDGLRTQPEHAEAAEARWRSEFGTVSPWPPDNEPPRLTPLRSPSRAAPRVERPPRVDPPVPRRPHIPTSEGVKRPARPIPPTRPVKDTEKTGQDAEPGKP